MSKLITLNKLDDDELLEKIFKDELIVYEDIQGSKIWVNWDGENFNIKPKSLSNKSINIIDLAMQNYYNPALDFLNSLDDRVKSLLNKKWWFGFEYFPDEQPANIEYDKIPRNRLALTTIYKKKKYTFNIDEIDEYSRLLNVDKIPIIYKGKLTEQMKEAIKYFLNTSEEDLGYVFGEKSFAYFFYKILNPSVSNSFLMESDFQENIQKIIIRSSCDDSSFQLLNPLYKKMEEANSTEFVEIYTLILVNFLNFCQSIDFDEVDMKGNTKEDIYISFCSSLFNSYLENTKEDLVNFDFVIPEFFDSDKFKINTDLISNKETLSNIKEDPKLEYIFKVILGSFNKKKKKPIGIFTENTIKLFNKFVDGIEKHIDDYIGRINEIELNKKGLLDFSDFFDISYDSDSEGKVYPDVYKEFGKDSSDSKDKKDKYKGIK